MEEKRLSAEQQLDLISTTINNSNAHVKRNSGTPFLIWGYTMIAMYLTKSILQLSFEGDLRHFALTAIPIYLAPVIALIVSKIVIKDKAVTSNNSKGLRKLWIVIGVASLLVMLTTSHLFTFTWLLGIGMVATGAMMKERSVTSCGIAGMVTSIILPFFSFFIKPRLFSPETWTEKIDMGFCSISPMAINAISFDVIMIIIFTILFIIPGHMLNHKYNKTESKCSKS